MPQASYPFAVGRVRALEGRVLTADRVERLIATSGAEETLKALREMGYGFDGDEVALDRYEAWIRRELADAAELVRSVSPEQASTDCFLLRNDYLNLKILFKSREMKKTAPEAALVGTTPYDVLVKAVYNDDLYKLSSFLREAVEGLNAKLASGSGPQVIDIALDRALFKHIESLLPKMKSKTVKGYFTDWADIVNLLTLLRVKRAGGGKTELEKQLLPCGVIPAAVFITGLDNLGKVTQAMRGRAFFAKLSTAISHWEQTGSAADIEREADDYLLNVFKKKRWNIITIEPLIGYLLAKEREAAAIRLVMVGKINDFPQDALRERLRELYV